jgi:hypothetical protein
MARSEVQGVCRLCGSETILCKSHYLGKALYRLISKTSTPIGLTRKIIAKTPRQVLKHLLCSVCEDRFNKYGERAAFDLINRGDRFSLLDRMRTSPHFPREHPFLEFSGRDLGIDTEQLGYFTLSVLWRGSVTSWRTLKGQSTSIKLGAYEERIRKYLLGETAFPHGAYVIVTACTDRESQEMILFPWEVTLKDQEYSMFEILIRGIWFRIVLGTSVPAGLSGLCAVRSSQQVIFMADCKTEVLHATAHFFDTAVDTVRRLRPAE